MYKQLLGLLLLATAASAVISGWRDCGSHLGRIYRVSVTNCTQTPCIFHIGQNYTIEVDASSLVNSVNLPFQMNIRAALFPIPITILEGNACHHFTHGSCPALNGATFTWRIQYHVVEEFPRGMNGIVRALVWNDYGSQGICVDVDVFGV